VKADRDDDSLIHGKGSWKTAGVQGVSTFRKSPMEVGDLAKGKPVMKVRGRLAMFGVRVGSWRHRKINKEKGIFDVDFFVAFFDGSTGNLSKYWRV
jgi:hypothetical protein